MSGFVSGRGGFWEEDRSGVFYSPPGWTLHVSAPAQLSRSLLWSNTLSIGSDTCVLMECHSGVRSS